MAPAKNPHTSSGNNSQNSNSPNKNHDIDEDNSLSASTVRKTGTVPKTSTSSVATKSNATAPTKCISTNVGQQQIQQRMQQRKNTEIVAPIRRELNDLNDYFLSTVVNSTVSNRSHDHQYSTVSDHKQQNSKLKNGTSNCGFKKQQQQLQQNFTEGSSGVSGCDIEYLQENQRFCYPVRPIPRRNPDQSQHNSANLNNYNTNLINQAATIGVVIPTPGLAANTEEIPINQSQAHQPAQQQQQQLVLVPLQQLIDEPLLSTYQQQQHNILPTNLLDLATSLSPRAVSGPVASTINTNQTDAILLQRLQLIQQFLNLTAKKSSNVNNPSATDFASATTVATNNSKNSSRSTHKNTKTKMVREANGQDVLVNSNSLEDVALSEASDRAQSIQSLHSIETPTPDNTPTYEELQERLERSNRNIQNMQEQQQQLLRLQNTAKQHLNDMERLRQCAGNLSFGSTDGQNNNGENGELPEYESLDEVHSDMETLVSRMKNLTAFINRQNELSSLLGEDGPEVMAEQQALQRKLEALRMHRNEMRGLVDELQDINRSAEKSVKNAKNHENAEKSNKKSELHVPVEYSRVVPIEVLQPSQKKDNIENITGITNKDENEAIAAALIQQRVSDIAAMKQQLKRLKDMMETVTLMENHSEREIRDIGRTPTNVQTLNSFDRDRTPIASISSTSNNDYADDDNLAEKVRILNEVSSGLRAQAENFETERNHIKALKKEIARRKEQAAAAAQLGEDALKRHSLTPTPIPRQRIEDSQEERDQLKSEYEVKKKEFELLCKRLQNEDKAGSATPIPDNHTNEMSEVEEDAEDFVHNSNYDTSRAESSHVNQSSSNAQIHCIKPTLGPNQRNISINAANTTCSNQDAASFEAGSLKSGSSHSFSMPPPMPAMGNNNWRPIPPPLPAAWNQNFYSPSHISTSHTAAPPVSSSAAPSSNECICNVSNNLNNASAGVTFTSSSAASQLATDPMLLQQFAQTQQILINSVCQCNQMLWHQQREIDALNNTIHILQERLLTLTGPSTADLSLNIRSESLPPVTMPGTIPNNFYGGINRAQSEQPDPFASRLPNISARTALMNCHQQQQQLHQQQQQHLYQQRQRGLLTSSNGYNYTNEIQQHNASSASASLYSTLNNAIQPTPQSSHFNNEAPQSPVTGGHGPGPIFMHHHNNSIHQNNANLRTQNHYANNLQQRQHQQQHNNVLNDSNTLNNQVQPGSRANNFWDNFRSYSRQNLLSINSNKSNEEQHTQCVGVIRSSNEQQQQFQNTQRLQQRFPEHFRVPAGRANIDNMSENMRPERSERGFLLGTVDLANEYDFIPNSSFRADNIADSFDNDGNDNDEDTTSEEIKRNLLVNALKNDKFTTKFYESIKEDVFRRLERIILERDDNLQRSRNEEFVVSQFTNDQHQNSLRDPLRKLENARIHNQQSDSLQQQIFQQNQLELDEQEEANNAETESNKGVIEVNNFTENDKPEEDENEDDTRLNHNQNSDIEFIKFSSYALTNKSPKITKSDQRKEEVEMTLEGACSLAAQLAKSSNKLITHNTAANTPDFDFIRNVMNRIRNRIQTRSTITDTILTDIIRLTAASASERMRPSNASTPNIKKLQHNTTGFSPKKIYAKIKKSGIPRQREEFLSWYESYLEKIFLVEQHRTSSKSEENKAIEPYIKNKLQGCVGSQFSQCENVASSSNHSNTNTHFCSIISTSNNTSSNTGHQQIFDNADDTDLAEADQSCSTNTSSSSYNQIKPFDQLQESKKENSVAPLDNFENNENPDEEKPLGGASSNLLHCLSAETNSGSVLTDNEGTNTNIEKTDQEIAKEDKTVE
ncbi:uncharacterized protein LOC119668543 isoform X2 [Teleopsis dalmanni]|uniref:uncharacterized protein LOC119668543 isoform X2 n=1 Tax=Teleopsis dalmanni TaxID=139649 RepID=UPI0018CF46CF|nr:uncharacterized protein LOC119668543 isoform X2 [Teleopsis dalmanni]